MKIYYGAIYHEADKSLYQIRYETLESNLIANSICPWPERVVAGNKKNDFFTKLEKSILVEGFRNPILVYAKRDKYHCAYGGSRLMVAHKHNLSVPCIVVDYVKAFMNSELLKDEDAIRSKYLDQPETIRILPDKVIILGCKHSHL